MSEQTPPREHRGLGSVLSGTLHLLGGQAIRLVSQSLLLVLLARGLGAESYSKVTALLALFLALIPFTSLGMPMQVVRGIARDPRKLSEFWGLGMFISTLLGLLVALILTFAAPGMLGIEFPRRPLFLFAVSELALYGAITVLNSVLQGQERLPAMARVLAGLSAARLAVMAALFFTVGLNLESFALGQIAGTAITLLVAWLGYGRSWGPPRAPRGTGQLAAIARDGFHISLAASGRSWLLGLDKMMLPGLFGLVAAAQYAAGFRVVMFAFIPLQALMAALYPRFFRRGGHSLHESLVLWRRIAPLAGAYALLMAVALYFAAPYIQPVLGEEFPEAAAVIRTLAWLLLIQALYVPLGDALTGADHLAYRGLSFVVAVLCNLGLNLWLIPIHGWRGAAVAAYASHFVLFLLYVVRVAAKGRVAPPAAP